MNEERERYLQYKNSLRILLFVALGIYVLSFALPSYDMRGVMGGGRDTLFGIQCFIMSLIFGWFSPTSFIGILANFILLSFGIMLVARKGVGNYKTLDICLTVLTIISVWIWLIFATENTDTLLIGYYLWAIASTMLAIGFVLTMQVRYKLYHLDNPKEHDDLDSLILDPD